MNRPLVAFGFVCVLTLLSAADTLHAGEKLPRWAAPPIRDAVTVRDGRTGELVSLDAMLEALAAADVVFLGETHTDETTHRAELAVYEGLLERRPGHVVLALEMFERDVQSTLDDYLAGRIDEATFRSKSHVWDNYRTAYRPLIEKAKAVAAPVIASNFPRTLRMKFSMHGAEALQQLSPDELKLVPRQYHPNTDAYWRRVDNAVRGHGAMMGPTDRDSRLYSTQSLWDNSMGEACADALAAHPGSVVLHINGGFHSAYWDGTVHQLKLRQPQARVKTVSIVPAMNPAVVEVEGEPVADFIVLAESRASDLNEGTWSVSTQQEVEYRLHMPAQATQQQPVSLLIWLNDDGLTSSDGMDLWRDRLGSDVAIVAVDAPYRETQSDMGVGGKWFWPDTFAGDISTMVGAVERIWGYVLRYYPIDPQRVCVAGEGTGATVAVAIALLSDRMDLHAVAVDPRFYAKLKDFPLPLPEQYGDLQPPQKKLLVLGTADDQSWWSSELEQYGGVGVTSRMELSSDDPWQRELQQENAVRIALGLPAVEPAGGTRRYLLIDQDTPRARLWARLQARRLSADGQQQVAMVRQPPTGSDSSAVSTEIRPEAFAASGALPPCPGPFGGTTVIVVGDAAVPAVREAWLALEANDPLAKKSRFHRLRMATGDGERSLVNVLQKLQSENRKNVLIVPAAFYADDNWMRSMKTAVRDLENQMTVQWLPGLGGRDVRLEAEPTAQTDLPLRHEVSVAILPESSGLQVRDRITLPGTLCRAGAEFTLHESLKITTSTPTVQLAAEQNQPGRRKYVLTSKPSNGVLELTYEGSIRHELSEQKEEYTRGFRQTTGIISQEGVYLDGDSQWVPQFDERLIQFVVEVQLPADWHVISQGNGTSRGTDGIARWDSGGLMQQVYLVGGPLHRYADAAGAVEALVYLHEEDEALARKYLDATARYLEMYRALIGPYPYDKFALVENFWETGYGMPSFTLLGPQVIRFPFILTSSYPHEILHNWWGNSVFVDYEGGNWCEGLTAYLADHLMQEQIAAGQEYRRTTLQKYRNYVQEGRDFPLNQFRERHSAATEAVGYGKSLMMMHMLRRQLGDDLFRQALAQFYRKFQGKLASFTDLRQELETTAQRDLSGFFQQWLDRIGAPALQLEQVTVKQAEGGWRVDGVLVQTQGEPPYALEVPITVQSQQGPETTIVSMDQTRQSFSIPMAAPATMLAVDPMFDLFRLLDPRETPASLGQIFGEPRVVAVLPKAASEAKRQAYRQLMEAWTSDSHALEIVEDTALQSLPGDCSVWVLGRENRFALALATDQPGASGPIAGDSMRLGETDVPLTNHCVVLVRRHADNLEKGVGLLIVEPDAAFAGMARKLPHYGKYSYLAFEGDEPTNVVKGQWSAVGSPLVVDLREDRSASLPPLPAEDRAALAELPPVFSSEKLLSHVTWLASPEREGRGLGSAGLQQSAEYIARQMEEAGLQPGGDNGGWFQQFTVQQGPDGQPVATCNVVGILPGGRDDWRGQSVVLGAHYDHLGLGWPDVRAEAQGQLHPGADDNASGVAVMLELARNLVSAGGGPRTLVFVAFSAEECGRHGSRYYVEHPNFPADQIRGMINLDTVGRLFDGQVAVHATATADEWQHIFRGCGFVTGVPNQIVPGGGEASDQMSFIEQGIPAVQIFTGAHGDYHRPSDRVDKIDAAGLVKVATFVKEALAYLQQRAEPMTVRLSGTAAQATAQPATGSTAGPNSARRVLVGTVPAFDFQGQGVKIESLVPDSPAAQAGLQPGDVIVKIGDRAIQDLRGYSELLKQLEPGQTITIVVQRGQETKEVQLTVVQR